MQPERVHQKDRLSGRWPQKTSVELLVLRGGEVVRWVEGPEEFLEILKFGVNRHFDDLSIVDVFWGFELPDY